MIRCVSFMSLFTLTLVLSLSGTAFGQHYQQTNLVSDLAGLATNPPDSNLQNPWGLTRSSTSPWWVANNGTGTSQLFDGKGNLFPSANPLTVNIPPPQGQPGPATPTGVVFNGTSDFAIAPAKPALFIFVTEDGTISGWNPGVDPNNAILKVDNSSNAVYKGVTISEVGGAHFLYVANFRTGQVEVYDTNFNRVHMSNNDFQDPGFQGRAPFGRALRHSFAPFNVQAIGGNLFVMYAEQDQQRHDEVDGAGLGFVDVFSPQGERLAKLEQGNWFNAPWGATLAPGDFGEFSHDILIGNFGSGQIAAFNPINGAFVGLMRNPDDSILSIDGLWSLQFGNSGNAGPYNSLFFTAGIQGEAHGLFGTLTAIAAEQNSDEP